MARGISTNRNTGSLAACLRSEEIAFVCRYYSFTTKQPQKRLTSAEADQLLSAKLQLVAVYEDGPTSADYFSRARGEQDGKHAYAYARNIGQPTDSAIYFAVDYDATQQDVDGPITQYFQGVKAGLTASNPSQAPYPTGVYGSGRVCAAIKDKQHLAQYAWLAESHGWAGHAGYTKPDIRQEVSVSKLCGLNGGAEGDYEDNFASGSFGAFSSLVGAAAPAALPQPPAAAAAPAATSEFAHKLQQLATDQFGHYHLYNETQSPLAEQIRAYWEDLDMSFPGVQTPWSAVFVSWLMRKAGAAPGEFKASNAHSRFVYWAIQNLKNNAGLFRAYPLADYAPKVGDIIQNNRDGQTLTYSFASAHQSYASHSAVVTERGQDGQGEYAITIGGNENNTVGRQRVALDSNGYVKQRAINPYISVIQCLK
ncbi:DUF2272 domain-containing protein [Massilia sp. BJB1822]|uniref:DUF2272 domain-containing protein n=1 Tax=Massilia sp. BJB1822 TaxID=2744470 RepID=UPI001594AE31|nr:DUF2272 domain-containing protein [Massilia sp. BJB1822]NVE01157.1 DUF2272 domain-containing protein [Massilia sp. BJB1822]